jgi:hypothetical protein
MIFAPPTYPTHELCALRLCSPTARSCEGLGIRSVRLKAEICRIQGNARPLRCAAIQCNARPLRFAAIQGMAERRRQVLGAAIGGSIADVFNACVVGLSGCLALEPTSHGSSGLGPTPGAPGTGVPNGGSALPAEAVRVVAICSNEIIFEVDGAPRVAQLMAALGTSSRYAAAKLKAAPHLCRMLVQHSMISLHPLDCKQVFL